MSKAEVSSRVSKETRAVIDGYQPMVTSMVTGKNGLSDRSRGCALWCDLAALKRNANATPMAAISTSTQTRSRGGFFLGDGWCTPCTTLPRDTHEDKTMSESPADRAEHMRCLWESLSPDPDKVLPPTPERFEDVRTVEELELWLMANQRTPNAAEREAMRQRLAAEWKEG